MKWTNKYEFCANFNGLIYITINDCVLDNFFFPVNYFHFKGSMGARRDFPYHSITPFHPSHGVAIGAFGLWDAGR